MSDQSTIEEIDGLYYGKSVEPDRRKAIQLCESISNIDPARPSAALYMALAYYEGAIYDQNIDRAKELMSEATNASEPELSEFAKDWLKQHNKTYGLHTCYECGVQLPANLMATGHIVTEQTLGSETTTTETFVPETYSTTSGWTKTYGHGRFGPNDTRRPGNSYDYEATQYNQSFSVNRSYVVGERAATETCTAHITKQWLCFDCLPEHLSEDELVDMALDGDVRAIEYLLKSELETESLIRLAERFSWATDRLKTC